MTDWSESTRLLNQYIRPQTFPVGIKLIEEKDQFPAKTRRPGRDLGFKTTVCVAIAMTRKYGWTVGISPDDNMCPVAALFYGWAANDAEIESDLFDFVRAMNYAASEEALAKMIEVAKKYQIEKGRYSGVVFSPVELGRIDPDMVMIFCKVYPKPLWRLRRRRKLDHCCRNGKNLPDHKYC